MEKQLIVLEKKPKLPTNWSYESSAKKVKILVYKWKNLTQEVLQELWVAREILSKTGARTDLKPQETWGNYCNKIGIEQRTANRWLEKNLGTNVSRLENEPLKEIVGKYNVIVIDPPWPYGTEYDSETRRVASPYPEKSIEELKNHNLPIADDCVLWLWATHKFLFEAFELLKTWGFEYKLTLVWDKQKLGMGSWLRCQAEFCLLGIKGSPRWNLKNERDIISFPRRQHSRKPEEFYKMVKQMTLGKRIDYFSREKHDGFEQYGNEPNKF